MRVVLALAVVFLIGAVPARAETPQETCGGDYDAASALHDTGNFSESVKLARCLAEAGDPLGQHLLGYLYGFGQGVSYDPKKENYWYRKAADQGLAKAQYNLAYNLKRGIGGKQDIELAIDYFEKASENSYVAASHALGVLYDKGEIVPQDQEKAIHWYRVAAHRGKHTSQFRLGVLLWESGRQDEAVEWLFAAGEQGYKPAWLYLWSVGKGDLFEDKLTARQIVCIYWKVIILRDGKETCE